MPIRRYLSLYNTHYLTEKLGLTVKFPEPYAIIKPIIYLSFLTCMKNMKKNNGPGQYANCTSVDDFDRFGRAWLALIDVPSPVQNG